MKTERSILRSFLALVCGLLALGSESSANAAKLTLSWDALDDPSVVGYVIHYGLRSGHYINALQVPTGTSVTVRRLIPNRTYYFSLTSYDRYGTESPYSDEISWFIPRPVTITRSGFGTVFTKASPTDDPDINAYTIVAQPAAGMVFAGWTGSLTSSAPRLSFVWSSTMVLQANFIPNPFPAIQGTYNGLLTSDGQPDLASSGSFSLSASRHGTFSGRLQVGTQSFRLSGRLDAQCRAGISFSHLKQRPLTLALAVGTDVNVGQISGTLSDGNWLANLSGERAVFDATSNPAPFAGRYTLVFPGSNTDPMLPTGHGFGSVCVFRSGLTVFSGALADGTNIRHTATLSTSSNWPLFMPLYGGYGALIGWPALNNGRSTAAFVQVTWIKLADPSAAFFSSGFTNQIETLGSAYIPPSGPDGRVGAMTNASFVCSGGNLDSSFTNSVAMTPHGRVTNLSGTALNLSIFPNSGIFRGNVLDPSSSQRFALNGAVLQNVNAGFGFLLGTNLSSSVTLEPSE